MYCDQPNLLTRDPGGGVNEEIPHRWAKQPKKIAVLFRIIFRIYFIPTGGQNSSIIPYYFSDLFYRYFSGPYFGLACDHGNSFLCLEE